jgi:hypothetical protein
MKFFELKPGYHEWNLWLLGEEDTCIYTIDGETVTEIEDIFELNCIIDAMITEIKEDEEEKYYQYDLKEEDFVAIAGEIRQTLNSYYEYESEKYELLKQFLKDKDYEYDENTEECFSLRISYFSNCGGDIQEEYYGSNYNDITCFDDIIREIDQGLEHIYNYFDVDEYVKMWLEAKSSGVCGIPSAVDLVDDAREIEEHLKEISENFYKDWCSFYFENVGEIYNKNYTVIDETEINFQGLKNIIKDNNLKLRNEDLLSDIKDKIIEYEVSGRQDNCYTELYPIDEEFDYLGVYKPLWEYHDYYLDLSKIINNKNVDIKFKFKLKEDYYYTEFNYYFREDYVDIILDDFELDFSVDENKAIDQNIEDIKEFFINYFKREIKEYNNILEKIENHPEQTLFTEEELDRHLNTLMKKIRFYKNHLQKNIEKIVIKVKGVMDLVEEYCNNLNDYYRGEDIDPADYDIRIENIVVRNGVIDFDFVEVA